MISGSPSFKIVVLLAITMAGASTARGDESAISTPYNYQPEEPGKQAFLLEDAGELEQLYVRRGIRYDGHRCGGCGNRHQRQQSSRYGKEVLKRHSIIHGQVGAGNTASKYDPKGGRL